MQYLEWSAFTLSASRAVCLYSFLRVAATPMTLNPARQESLPAGSKARFRGQAAQPVSIRRSVLAIYQRGEQIWSQAATALVSPRGPPVIGHSRLTRDVRASTALSCGYRPPRNSTHTLVGIDKRRSMMNRILRRRPMRQVRSLAGVNR